MVNCHFVSYVLCRVSVCHSFPLLLVMDHCVNGYLKFLDEDVLDRIKVSESDQIESFKINQYRLWIVSATTNDDRINVELNRYIPSKTIQTKGFKNRWSIWIWDDNVSGRASQLNPVTAVRVKVLSSCFQAGYSHCAFLSARAFSPLCRSTTFAHGRKTAWTKARFGWVTLRCTWGLHACFAQTVEGNRWVH